MAGKPLLGTIPCPCCKEISMEVRPDRSGAAFGYCPLCSQQLRVGAERDRPFRENWGLPLSNDGPVTVTEGGATSADLAQEVEPAPVTGADTDEGTCGPVRTVSKKRATCLLDV